MSSISPSVSGLWATKNLEGSNSSLGSYLNSNLENTKRRLPGELANRDFEAFKNNVLNLTVQLDEFLHSTSDDIAFLVLGKIQSGKTAHLVAATAWAADSKIAFTSIFTGTNNPLNKQTVKRLERDLSNLNQNSKVRIFEVPTKDKGKSFEDFYNQIKQLVEKRLDSSNQISLKVMPVFVTMKNRARINALIEITKRLIDEFPGLITSLLIDDEADQASQNTKVQTDDVSATYEAIGKLRTIVGENGISHRNILLSYTATPQAVLLAEADNQLRPNYCVTIDPRTGYFGLDEIMSENFLSHVKTADDWEEISSTDAVPPNSLRHAIDTFLVTSWIRNFNPGIFYSDTQNDQSKFSEFNSSVQMLIHESHEKTKHEIVYAMVTSIKNELLEVLEHAYSSSEITGNEKLDIGYKVFLDNYHEVMRNLDKSYSKMMPDSPNKQMLTEFYQLLEDSQNLVINSSEDKPGYSGEVPVEDRDWGKNMWFVIGGNILGRGLTLPQLTTTYFVRHAKSPNYDTISQHMRFCGYRANYAHLIYLFAQERTYNTFKVMQEIENVVWNMASKWSREKTNIYDQIPNVLYVSSLKANLNPTRKSIFDPQLEDRTLGETIFSSKNIASPQMFRMNLELVKNFGWADLGESTYSEDFQLIKVKSFKQLKSFILNWSTDANELSIRKSLAELYDPEYQSLGLSHIPTTVVLDSRLLNFQIHDFVLMDGSLVQNPFKKSKVFSRAAAQSMSDSNMHKWVKDYSEWTPEGRIDSSWPKLGVQHIGDSQRKFRDLIGHESTILYIEPMFVHQKGNETRKVGFGIAFTILGPKDFEVRIIGMGPRLKVLLDVDK
jgi:hypothetical protein